MPRGRYNPGALTGPARRRGKARRRMLFAFAFLLAVAGYAFFSSAYFRVEMIEVSGNSKVTDGEAVAASGLMTGTSLLSVRPRQAEEALESLPYVRRARVSGKFPSKVRIVLEERVPVGYLLANRSFHAVDREGFILEVWEGAFRPDEPVITGDLPYTLNPGFQVMSRLFQEACRLLDFMGEERDLLSEVYVKDEELVLYTMEGVTVFLGAPDARVKERIDLLMGILEDASEEGFEMDYVDLRASRPVIRVKEGSRPVPDQKENEIDFGTDWQP